MLGKGQANYIAAASKPIGMASMAAVKTALPRAGLGSQRPVIPSGTDARKILSPIVTTLTSLLAEVNAREAMPFLLTIPDP